jgi:hypothetical protein
MEPIRVKLYVKWDIPAPQFEQEFEGKEGTLVWVSKGGWGDLQCSVELDVPHSRFGKFCNICYIANSNMRKNEVFAEPTNATLEDCYRFARLLNDDWKRFHSEHGDPLPWSAVVERLPHET